MAKRYGRNQRRRHREEIAQQATEIAALRSNMEYQAASLAKARAEAGQLRALIVDWDTDVSRLLGGYSAFRLREPRERASSPFLRVPIEDEIGPHIAHVNLGGAVASAAMTVQHLNRLCIRSDADRMRLRHIIRLVVERPDGSEEVQFAYQVEDREIFLAGRRDLALIERMVSRALVEAAAEYGR